MQTYHRRIRVLVLSGTVPEELPIQPPDPTWGDAGPDGRLLFREGKSGAVQIFDPRSNKTQTLEGIRGNFLRWSADGSHFATLMVALQPGDADAGIWVYDSNGGAARQVFRGWALCHAVLWRVHLDGSPPVRMRAVLRLRFAPQDMGASASAAFARFEVHPDHRRIVIEAFRFQESDISMIENIR